MNTAPKLHDSEAFWNAVCEWTRKYHGWLPAKCQADELLAAIAPPSGEGVGCWLFEEMYVTQWADPAKGIEGSVAWRPEASVEYPATLVAQKWARNVRPCYTTPQSAPVDGEFVLVPREATSDILVAMAAAIGMKPLGDGADGSYPITGKQSTIRRSTQRPPHPPASQERGGVIEVDENEVRQELASLVAAAGTQKRFAELMGVSDSYVTDVLHGRRAMPGVWVIPSGYRMRWIKDTASPPSSAAEECAPFKPGDEVVLNISGERATVHQCWNAVGGWRVLAQVHSRKMTANNGMIDFPAADVTSCSDAAEQAKPDGGESDLRGDDHLNDDKIHPVEAEQAQAGELEGNLDCWLDDLSNVYQLKSGSDIKDADYQRLIRVLHQLDAIRNRLAGGVTVDNA